MPVQRCQEDGKPGWRCGEAGKCYTYPEGDSGAQKRAKQKAIDQCIAIGEDPSGSKVVERHNRVVQAGRRRAEALEPKLVAAIEPVLNRAAEIAAQGFEKYAVDHLSAAGDGPADWTPPAADEVIDVDAVIAQLRTKTDPVRQALIETVMTAALRPHGIDWDATNPLTARVLSQSGSQIVGIGETTQLNVMRIIREAYENGLTIPDTAKAIRAGMKEAGPGRALLIARCLPGEALVDGAVVGAVTQRWYEGHMVVLVTEAGREFTATPNHPMLTSRGWRPAGVVGEGHYLICRGGHEHAGSARHEDVHHPPATIAEVYEAAAAVGVVERRAGGHPDFHGDGREGQVDIARPGRQLLVGDFAALYQHRGEEGFAPSLMLYGAPFCPTCRHLLAVEKSSCGCGTPARDPRLAEYAAYQAAGYAEAAGERLHGLAALEAGDEPGCVNVVAAGRGATATLEVPRPRLAEGARLDPSLAEPLQDGRLVHAYLLRDGACAGTVEIEADPVVSRRLVEFSGHVYNLMTTHGYFTVNGGYTGNTELVGAVNGGSLAATEIVSDAMGPAGEGRFMKQWLTAEGAQYPRHEEYEDLDGQTVDLDQPFDVGGIELMFPGDPDGPPEEICNCRCAIAYVEGGE